jgi:NAD(P)-dependent dehydrogenase (short-subunit alcohol dehydrogenase family)
MSAQVENSRVDYAKEDVRRVIITGANSGIGKAAAIRFAKEGFEVVMACRNMEKAASAHSDLKQAAPNGTAHIMTVDLSSFESICNFTNEYKKRFGTLDVLIHNAAYIEHGKKGYQVTTDGIERSFATNVFGPHLMTERLLDHLSQGRNPVVLHACSSSIKYFFDPKRTIDFDHITEENRNSKDYNVYKMYGDSKMGLYLLTRRMSSEYIGMGIRTNALMIPSTRVSIETLKKMSLYYQLVGFLLQNLNPFSRTPEMIADIYYNICTSDKWSMVNGAMFDYREKILGSPVGNRSQSPLQLIKELWNTTRLPPYAVEQEPMERLWSISSEVIDPWRQRP